MKRALCFALTALIILFCLAACKGGSQQRASNTFKIGIITSLTGPAAAFGQAHKNGYTVALDELNAKGGVMGKKIELVYYDDQRRSRKSKSRYLCRQPPLTTSWRPALLGHFASARDRARTR